MKAMTCKQLGGACDKEFQADTFDEISEMSEAHWMEMYQKGDEDRLKGMSDMQQLMKNHDEMNEWFDNKRKEFNEWKNNFYILSFAIAVSLWLIL